MRIISIFSALILCSPAFAENGIPSYKDGQSSESFFKGKTDMQITHTCANVKSTLEVNFCAKRRFEATNRKLEDIYKSQLQSIREHEALLRREDALKASSYFISSQEGWKKYRDDTCVFAYLYLESGTISGYEYFDCLSSMTNQRIKTLSKSDNK